jgi:uncharacterized protein
MWGRRTGLKGAVNPSPSSERVRNFSAGRRAWEHFQALATTGGWPARLARILGEPTHVVVEQYQVEVPGTSTQALRLAFASDFHAGPTTHPELLASSCETLARVAPDVLLLGGDFVCLRAQHVDSLAERLGNVPAPLGRYAVLGNHDLWTDFRYIERRLEAAGVQLLTNRNVRLPPPYGHIWLCGLDDHSNGRPDGAAAMRGADGVRIVLMHAPSGLLDLDGERFDLGFCGHTHGGQIALPGGHPIVVPRGALSRRYARGAHQLVSGGTLLVSRGIGCSTLPFRVYSAPEVIVCTVIPRGTGIRPEQDGVRRSPHPPRGG